MTVEAREERRVIVRSAPNPATGKISVEVSTDVQMVLWRGSVFFKNEVHDIFL